MEGEAAVSRDPAHEYEAAGGVCGTGKGDIEWESGFGGAESEESGTSRQGETGKLPWSAEGWREGFQEGRIIYPAISTATIHSDHALLVLEDHHVRTDGQGIRRRDQNGIGLIKQ